MTGMFHCYAFFCKLSYRIVQTCKLVFSKTWRLTYLNSLLTRYFPLVFGSLWLTKMNICKNWFFNFLFRHILAWSHPFQKSLSKQTLNFPVSTLILPHVYLPAMKNDMKLTWLFLNDFFFHSLILVISLALLTVSHSLFKKQQSFNMFPRFRYFRLENNRKWQTVWLNFVMLVS